MNVTVPGNNQTTVTQASTANLIVALASSKAVTMALAAVGIAATPENAALAAGLFMTAATHTYCWVRKAANHIVS